VRIRRTELLKQSGVLLFQTPRSCRMVWTVDYASFVHEGAWIVPYGNQNSKRVYIPGKPLTDVALGIKPLAGVKPFDFKAEAINNFGRFFRS
jgi:hypothetical protein